MTNYIVTYKGIPTIAKIAAVLIKVVTLILSINKETTKSIVINLEGVSLM